MNAQTRHPARSQIALAKQSFNLEDEDERRALDWIRRFHSPRSIYRLLDVRLTRRVGGTKSIFILTRSQVKRAGSRPEWLVIEYDMTPEAISVCWRRFHGLHGARVAFTEVGQTNRPELQGSQ
jgi:hypothetical protein